MLTLLTLFQILVLNASVKTPKSPGRDLEPRENATDTGRT